MGKEFRKEVSSLSKLWAVHPDHMSVLLGESSQNRAEPKRMWCQLSLGRPFAEGFQSLAKAFRSLPLLAPLKQSDILLMQESCLQVPY